MHKTKIHRSKIINETIADVVENYPALQIYKVVSILLYIYIYIYVYDYECTLSIHFDSKRIASKLIKYTKYKQNNYKSIYNNFTKYLASYVSKTLKEGLYKYFNIINKLLCLFNNLIYIVLH